MLLLGENIHAIQYDVTFTVPTGEGHTFAQFEALTGYMPAEFAKFWKFDPKTKALSQLDDRPGEQDSPVIFSTADGKYAMGIYAPEPQSRSISGIGYGRFRFSAEKVTKWNCVFRVREPKGIAAGDYKFRMFVAVGTLDDVRATIGSLNDRNSSK